jgi:hypothetical protein
VKTAQLMISTGENVNKPVKKSSIRPGGPLSAKKDADVRPTASQQRLLQILITGTETKEPNVLAAGRL